MVAIGWVWCCLRGVFSLVVDEIRILGTRSKGLGEALGFWGSALSSSRVWKVRALERCGMRPGKADRRESPGRQGFGQNATRSTHRVELVVEH